MGKSSDSGLARAAQRLSGALTKVRDAGGVKSAAGAAWRMIRREGFRSALSRIGGMSREAARYAEWVAAYDTPGDAELEALRLELDQAGIDTLISVVVPVYNTPERYLREMIDSVLRQAYPHWELCVADDASTAPHVRTVLEEYARRDARIRIVIRPSNGHISEASNSALELARGSFVALLDHDDILPPHALAVVAKYIHAHPDARLLYSDEDKLSEDGRRHTPHFKPDWDPELILQYNLFSHLGVYETRLMREVGGFRKGLEGSQDHDLVLRCLRAAGDGAVVHIPHVLYHWRTIEGSTAVSADEKPYALVASIRAISDHLREMNVNAEVHAPQPQFPFVRIDYRLPARPPSVHLLVMHAGDTAALTRCVQSIVTRTVYANFRVSVVGAPAEHNEMPASFGTMPEGVGFIPAPTDGVAMSRLEDTYLCFVDERVEVSEPSWLDELMRQASRPGIGAVGASLWCPDGRLHAGGLILTSETSAVPIHAGIARRSTGYFGRAMLTQTVSALSWSCAVVNRTTFLAAGGFGRNEYGDVSGDIALSLRLAEDGSRNVFVPRAAVLTHARPSDAHVNANAPRSEQVSVRDRAYNPNLSLMREARSATFELSFPPRIEPLE
ncbi:glycosyltransferase family 2 protein [Caballeronia insecticola]|uniref:Glycosyl transferase family 2 n=1 Tax=Caballeronia insecticola TaxID=758793 RepID=R4WSL9_9BURK|nr:glycosyltransferase [Caballeronia insecticola]BAN23950.1 glycosyl transferase family 2 [Caballeronia insecticola]